MPKPVDELRHFLVLEAVLALQRGEGEIREPIGIGRDREPAQEHHDRAGVEETIDEPRSPPEERYDLLQVNVDAAVEHALFAHVRLVGARRSVNRDQRHVVALPAELSRESVVAETAPAVHVRGSGGDGENPQSISETVDHSVRVRGSQASGAA